MKYKKILFPIGAGDDVTSRIYGALQVAKWLKVHIEVLSCQIDPSIVYNMKMTLRGGVLFEEFLKSAKADLEEEHMKNKNAFIKMCKELDIEVSDHAINGKASANFIIKDGKRSVVVERESKFYDLIVAAVPITGKITGTFESAVMKSGKDCIVIPRNLTKFEPKNILVSWTSTPNSASALTNSLDLLKKADRVHCITAKKSFNEDSGYAINKLEDYLKMHDINATCEVINTYSIPGKALAKVASDGNFDLVVAGRQGENGLREMVLGGTSKFFLEHTKVPIFM
ncbi:universal stress protein [Campylobacter pinnipediorum]|uniref:universal stress protein n=1 Tax=Campylobacter pinnipediorum TaxID=1965231 RepID=UPI00084D5176|nr:universal stress protein [Campylobacter pinnipediorum]